MEDKLISFETAKLAKEKGFNEYCVMAYFKNDKISLSHCYSLQDDECRAEDEKYAPTQSLLAKWLRDNHNTHIIIQVASAGDGEEKIKWYYSYVTGIHDCLSDEAFGCTCDDEFNSYEEALEEALKVTLDCIF